MAFFLEYYNSTNQYKMQDEIPKISYLSKIFTTYNIVCVERGKILCYNDKKVLGVDIASFNNMGEGFMNSIYTILDFVYEDFIVHPKEALEE